MNIGNARESTASRAWRPDTSSATPCSGWQVVNVDCTVITEAPKIAPRAAAMQGNLAGALGVDAAVLANERLHVPEPLGDRGVVDRQAALEQREEHEA